MAQHVIDRAEPVEIAHFQLQLEWLRLHRADVQIAAASRPHRLDRLVADHSRRNAKAGGGLRADQQHQESDGVDPSEFEHFSHVADQPERPCVVR